MRLYHYLETKWALDDIKRRRLKISTITDLNDPYEFESVCSDNLLTQFALDKTKDAVVDKYGIVCFSRCWNSVLMWSHYADKHKGMCLGFDVPDEVVRPVDYVAKPHIVGNLVVADEADFLGEAGEAIVNLLAGAKYEGWAYEQEVRIHATRHDVDEMTGQRFYGFSDSLALKEVIAGARFPSSKTEIERALAGYVGQEDVKIVKVRASAIRFEIVVDRCGF